MCIVYENIVFSIGVKAVVLVLGALGLANMWAAIFADVGVMILAVCNATRALFVPKDLRGYGRLQRQDEETARPVPSTQQSVISSGPRAYKIEVDCPNCAGLMEEAARKTKGVRSATVNFMAQEMKVELEDGENWDQVMTAVRDNCKKVEDDCEVYL